MSKAKSVGRPVLFHGAVAKVIATMLKKNGLTGGKAALAELGEHLMNVSIPTLAKVAKEHGVEFPKGRPHGSVAKAPVAKAATVEGGKKRGRPFGSKNKVKEVVATPEVAPVAPEVTPEVAPESVAA